LKTSVALVRTIALATLISWIAPAIAQDRTGFDPLVVDDLSAPKSVRKMRDPTGSAPAPTVYAFTIPAGYCNPKKYDASQPDSDCTWKSTRSQYRENVFATKKNGNAQPREGWYGWQVYFPADFPYGAHQTKGHYEFAYWHNHQCPHLTFSNSAGQDSILYLETNKALGNYECEPGARLPVADFKNLVGKWSKFEVYVKWANDASGKAIVYLDGKQAQTYTGPTLVAGFEKTNYFKFGIYLCCTDDVKRIKEASVYYSNVRRAATREGLAK
jgi:hypothetical protein